MQKEEIKELFDKREISLLLPEGEGGALTGEVHLIKHEGKKYIIRKCSTRSKAKYYEYLSSEFERYGFFPKFLGSYGKNILYEYIEGRDLAYKDGGTILEQIGKIGAHVNKVKFNYNFDKDIKILLGQLVSGKYKPSNKVLIRRERSNITTVPKAILSREYAKQILNLYYLLKKKTRAKITLDISDYVPGNFRLRKGKVYLVDIESIKPSVKGKGIAKCFRGWCKVKTRRERFLFGYNSVSSAKFLNDIYLDFCHMLFAVQALHFKAQVDRDNKEDLNKLKELLEKYKIN